ncbi:phosphate signaling complex protein PhoU [bacterium]|nr:phosphate signaling complex protein PhoU [candidate division CSSED10-310 bacterium]
MTIHFVREIERLKTRILSLSAYVEENVIMAVKALNSRDAELAREVRQRDRKVDEAEVDLEEECLKILALHQPVAQDLRFIIAVLKITNDLERIGDHAVNISYQSESFTQRPQLEIPGMLLDMAEKTKKMLTEGLDALVNLDLTAARRVCLSDDAIDALHHQIYEVAMEEVLKNPALFGTWFKITNISHQLERIADLATNIAEDVMYMVEGRIVRHVSRRSNTEQ